LAGTVPNTTDYWLPENAPLLTLDKFLDQLKGVYNAHWRIVDNKLYFQRKDYWIEDIPVFDFTKNAPDRDLLLKGLCFEWNEQKFPAYIEGLYTEDAADVCGNAALGYYNDIIGTGDVSANPNFDGGLLKTTPFGAAKFRLDGADNDYILDAAQQVNNASLVNGALWVPSVMNTIFNKFFSVYGDYALLLKQETTTLPKIIIWNGGQMLNAKAYNPHTAVENLPNGGIVPQPNPPYNNYGGVKQWRQQHEPDTKVLGNGQNVTGVYYLTSPWAANRNWNAWLVNYPMYFAAGFKDGIWDWFHWIDDPRFTPSIHKTVTARLENCCSTLKRLKVFDNGKDIVLGQKLKADGLHGEGYITGIEVSYDPGEEDGMYIEIRANI